MGRHPEFNKEEVVQKAMLAFWKSGCRDTTPQVLIDATGLSRSSLYATFGSKQGVFLAAVDLYVEEQVSFLTALLADGTVREGFERLYALMVDMMRPGGGGMTCLLAGSLLEMPVEDDETRIRIARGQALITAVYEARLQRAIDEGEIDGRRTAKSLARYVATVNDGIQIAARAQASEEELRVIAQMTLDAVC